MSMDIVVLSAGEIASRVRDGKCTATQVAEAFLGRIEAVDKKVAAFLRVDRDKVLAQAKGVDARKAKGETLGALAGVPVAIKDNILERDERGTCASRMLENFVSPYEATVVKKLRAADAVLLGRTNMDEFAMGSSTENSAFHTTKNPWDIHCIPGGSSGGSAAAVGARMVPLALGSDTGGSIRQPAGLCGIAGLKPTYGRVSRYGLVAFASSLDQIGPLAHNVQDAILCQQVVEGHDPKDSTCADMPAGKYALKADGDLKGLRVGMPKEYFVEGLEATVREAVEKALKDLEQQGAELIPLSLPHTDYALSVYYLVATAEASSNLARYDAVHYGLRKSEKDLGEMYLDTRSQGFGAEVKRRIVLGTYALSAGYYDAFYLKALKVRTLIRRDFEQAFEQCDVLAMPTTPSAAFRVGERMDDPLAMYLSDVFTISANLAGVPAVSIPCGFNATGLPIGLQLMAKPFAEADIFRVALAYQARTDHHTRVPEIS